MNWLFPLSKGSGPLPPLNSLQQQRQRQIESLKAAHSSLAEIQKDVEYRIPFTVNNSTISVNILLPPQFPQEKPAVSVYPPVGHHLVDSNNGTMVTSPLITNFGMHSDLGKVIQSLLDEFWKSPPVLTSGPTGFPYNMFKPSGMPPYPTQGFHYGPRLVGPTPPPMPHVGVEGAHVHSPPWAAAPAYGLITDLPLPVPTADSQAGLNGHMYKMPEIPETFPELSEMSVSQLEDMSEPGGRAAAGWLFACLPQLKQVTTDKEELVDSIVGTWPKNLQLEPQLEGRETRMLFKVRDPDNTHALALNERRGTSRLTQNKSAFETKMQRQHDISESCSLSALQASAGIFCLKVIGSPPGGGGTEETAERFLEGKTDIDDVPWPHFMEKRTLCHSREGQMREKLSAVHQTHTDSH
ncbi:hypothetical protein J4Q44_G00039960 [Coregonus suidteri]|uniref:Uncharacterized protein n=1 Tax=Coregonus suidteri TaxID=861788 RepID=A0AAN8M8F9_9TELE